MSEKTFEGIKHINEYDAEYWLARELQEVLQYTKWENFNKVIDTAKIACNISKHAVSDHFIEVNKPIEMPTKPRTDKTKIGFPDLGKTKMKLIKDYHLSRYACYLIVMNGDPRKEIIAQGQTYFAIKTRQQEYAELFHQLDEDERRLFARSDIKRKNLWLMEAAKRAGIQEPIDYAIFQDFGYMGLYNGETARDIAKRKGLADKNTILDHMGSAELGANIFRITQTDEVMKNNNVSTPKEANDTHYNVGKEVRETIKRIGATMPEKLPTPEKGIPELEAEQRKQIKHKSYKHLS